MHAGFSWAAWLWAVLFAVVAVALAVYSTHLNWRYGQEFFGGGGPLSFAFAIGIALLDLAKFLLAAQVAAYWRASQPLKAATSLLMVVLASGLSMTAMLNVGFEGAETSLGEDRAERQKLADFRDRRADLQRQIEELGTRLPTAVIEHQMQALQRDRRFQTTAGCTDVTATASRAFCAERDRLFAQLAAATKSEHLQAEVEKLNREIHSLIDADTVVDRRRAMTFAAERFGVSADAIAAGLLVAVALAVELFGVVMSAVASERILALRVRSVTRATVPPEPQDLPEPPIAKEGGRNGLTGWPRPGSDRGRDTAEHDQAATAKHGNRSSPLAADSSPDKILNCSCPIQFWDNVVVPVEGGRLGASDLYAGYQDWSGRRGEEPLAQSSFGRVLSGARAVRRHKSGGRIMYVDVALRP